MQVQVDQRPQHKSDTPDMIEDEVGSSLELNGTRDSLNRIPIVQKLRSTINK